MFLIAILLDEYFGYLKYYLMLVLFYFYFCTIFNAGLLLVSEYLYTVVLLLLLKLNYLSTASTAV